jgi:methylenetetrahydrofolate reductase (NADPH)
MMFSEAIKNKAFVVTAELSPPKGVDLTEVLKKADLLKGKVDGINATDNQVAVLHLSSVAFCAILKQKGFDPILQMNCRDRNALALQADLLGAYALGIRNVLSITGDYPKKSLHHVVKPVFDIDSVQLIKMIIDMNNGTDFAGEKLAGAPSFTVGGVVNPGADPIDGQIMKLKKKIDAGAQFIQTQIVYDVDGFKKFRDKTRDVKVKFLLGILPIRSPKMAENITRIPGVHIPKNIMERIGEAKDPVQEGIDISAEIINGLKGYIDGVHFMTLNNVEVIPEILKSIDK